MQLTKIRRKLIALDIITFSRQFPKINLTKNWLYEMILKAPTQTKDKFLGQHK